MRRGGREGGKVGERGRGEGEGGCYIIIRVVLTTVHVYMTMYNTMYLMVDSAHRNHVHTLQQFDTLVDMLKQLWKCLQ